MKTIFIIMIIGFAAIACTSRKGDSTREVDSLGVTSDSSELALTPAPSILASSPLPGYEVKNTTALADSVNFILLTNAEELDKNFVPSKNSGTEVGQPDFVINYIIGVVCKPTNFTTSVSIDKVEISRDEIGVFVNIERGAKQNTVTKASELFSIERRDGIASIQFYVNGKKDKSFFMTGL